MHLFKHNPPDDSGLPVTGKVLTSHPRGRSLLNHPLESEHAQSTKKKKKPTYSEVVIFHYGYKY